MTLIAMRWRHMPPPTGELTAETQVDLSDEFNFFLMETASDYPAGSQLCWLKRDVELVVPPDLVSAFRSDLEGVDASARSFPDALPGYESLMKVELETLLSLVRMAQLADQYVILLAEPIV